MNIKASYSYSHDVGNYFNSIYRFSWQKYGRENIEDKLRAKLPKNFIKALMTTNDSGKAKELIKDYLKERYQEYFVKYDKKAKELERVWKKRSKGVLNLLSETYGKPVPFKSVNVYLSSLPICPYRYPEWIIVDGDSNTETQLYILLHELNHFMFYYYFGYLKEKIGKVKFESLKEALTVLTNPDEKGYPAQKRLRSWLK